MQTDYKPFLDRLIDRYEGGYGWDHDDPGGPTKFGITCYDLAESKGEKMDSMQRWAPLVRAVTRDEAEAIYKKKYAVATAFDALPKGVDCCVLDYAVNSGPARAARVAAVIVGHPARDVISGPLLDKIKAMDPKTFVDAMCRERLRFMHSIRHGAAWKKFGAGWLARVTDVHGYCTNLINGHVSAVPAQLPRHGKARHTAPDATKHITHTVGGAAATSAGFHFSGQSLALTAAVAAVIVVLAFLVYHYRKLAAEKANDTVLIFPPLTPTPTPQVANVPEVPPVVPPK